jgi:hypothetical protein
MTVSRAPAVAAESSAGVLPAEAMTFAQGARVAAEPMARAASAAVAVLTGAAPTVMGVTRLALSPQRAPWGRGQAMPKVEAAAWGRGQAMPRVEAAASRRGQAMPRVEAAAWRQGQAMPKVEPAA